MIPRKTNKAAWEWFLVRKELDIQTSIHKFPAVYNGFGSEWGENKLQVISLFNSI